MRLGEGLRLVGSGGVGHRAWPGCHLAATSWVLPTVQEAKPQPAPVASVAI